jgi:hypothetical protein
MKLRKSMTAAVLMLAYASVTFGAVTAEEAQKLGTTLTPVGAEMAGNADGSIPAYTGGLTTLPADFVPGSGKRTDPFANEKPLFSIDAKNMEQYADKLTEGNKALMKKYPDYRIDVYKTHRTVTFPEYVLQGTARNAVSATTTNEGLSLSNAKSGIPFPIPKDGYETMWNHLGRFEGEAYQIRYSSYNVDGAGRKILSTLGTAWTEYPYYNKTNPSTDTYFEVKFVYSGPPRRNGEAMMFIDPLNMAEKSRRAWQYLPGQRRVRLAPTISFDTPNPGTSGATTYDDGYVFNGSLERYDWKLVGKKEMFVVYNAYKMVYQTVADDLLGPKFLNPDKLRFELHRVWVVEGTLKPGKRHIYAKRTLYLDEDSWAALAADSYDAQGRLYRTIMSAFTYSYDAKAPLNAPNFCYDLVTGSYSNLVNIAEPDHYIKYVAPFPATEWNPESLAGSGVE